MKKLFYSLAVVALVAVSFAACSNDNNDDSGTSSEPNIEARAAALGFEDANAYKASVAEQCAAGNHENCDINSDGTHQACAYADHSGKKHDGTHHNGSNHSNHQNDHHNNGNHH